VDTGRRLMEALLALEEPFRTTLLLRYHEGLAATEIARRQGVPEGTVRWRTKRGLAELRARLERSLGEEALGLALLELGCTAPTSPAAGLGPGWALPTAAAAAGVLVLGGAWWAWPRTEPRVPQGTPEVQTTSALIPGAATPSVPLAAAAAADPGRAPLVVGDTARLRILVNGAPQVAVAVAVAPADEDELPFGARTDASGWVELPASEEPRQVAVERVNAFPWRGTLALAGETELELPAPEGAALAGTLSIDGAPPETSLWLLLRPAGPALDTDDPRTILASDYAWGTTDSAGGFRFEGIPHSGALDLGLPHGLARRGTRTVTDPGQAVVQRLPGPAEDLVIELERHARVHGRVVEADGTTPVVGALVQLGVADGLFGRQTDAEGRFEIFVREPPRRIEIEWQRQREWNALVVDSPEGGRDLRELEAPPMDLDLGDLALGAGSAVVVEVRDPEGRPLAGAEAGRCCDGPTHVTGADGRATLGSLVPGTELVLTRRGFATAFTTLPDPLPETVEVVLQPTNDLELAVVDAAGAPLARITLELSAAQRFTSGAEPNSELWRRDARSRGGPGSFWNAWPLSRGYQGRRGSIWGGSPARVRFQTDAEGRCSVGDLGPLALHLAVLDDLGRVLVQEDLAPLGPTEARTLEVRVPVALAPLRGRVMTAGGLPVSGVRIELEGAGAPETASRGTGNDGRFAFRSLAAGGLLVRASAPGFLPEERAAIPAEELEIVLQGGLDLVVDVRDASGGPCPGGSVRALPVGEETGHRPQWIVADALGGARFLLHGLTAVPHTIVLEREDGLLAQTAAPAEGLVRFFVPAEVGTLELVWRDPGTPPPPGLSLRLEPSGGGLARPLPLEPGPEGRWSVAQLAGSYELVVEAMRTLGAGLSTTEVVARKPLTLAHGETVVVEVP